MNRVRETHLDAAGKSVNVSRMIVDAAGEPLACALKARPDLVKPDVAEAERLVGAWRASGSPPRSCSRSRRRDQVTAADTL